MKPIHLYRARQAGLYRQACERMARLSPGWSDAIASDPAVAILELACYLSELQGRRLDAVGSAHYRAFLRLLGAGPEELTPASLLARPCGETRPYQNQRFWMDGVPYEVTEGDAARGEIADVLLECGGQRRAWRGEAPLVLEEDGACIALTLSQPLCAGRSARLWCGLRPEEGRVPPGRDTPPPVRLRAWVPEGADWQEIPVLDGTCGLLRSGFWTVTPDREARTVRFTLEGRLEGQPCVTSLALEPVRLEQRRTRSCLADLRPPFRLPEGWLGERVLRCFLPWGDGWREEKLFVRDGQLAGWGDTPPAVIRAVSVEPDFPAQFPLRALAEEQVALEEPGVLRESLRLMVEEDGVWYDCPIREAGARTLPRGCSWEPEGGLLRFGDGRDFRIPKEGRLLVASCASTLGSGGNGAFGLFSQGGTLLQALHPAAGGRDREPAEDAFFRAAREQGQLLRAVTPSDYEALARRTPGLALQRVRALTAPALGRQGAGITLLAKPRSREPLPVLTGWQAERLQAWLEQFRLIGVPVFVQSPRYLPLEVLVSLRASRPVEERAVRDTVLQVVDGVSGPADFGAELSYPLLFAALGGLEHVTAVTALEMRPLAGGAQRTRDGSLRLEADVLSYLERLRLSQA